MDEDDGARDGRAWVAYHGAELGGYLSERLLAGLRVRSLASTAAAALRDG